MIKRIIIFLLFVVTSFNLSAQDKELSLEDAVLRQFSLFYPSSIPGLQWIAESDEISFLADDYKSLLKMKAKKSDVDTLLKLSDLNVSLGLDMKSMKNPVWLDESSFYFRSGDAYYKFDIKEKAGAKWLEIPKGQNMAFNHEEACFAFTIDNNLFVKEGNKEVKAISSYADINIVVGQAIARHEFGIGKGIFWSPKGKKLAFYQKDETDVADYPILDITTTPGSLINVKYPMAGQGSEFASVGVYDLKKDETTYLWIEGPRDQYLTNLAWSPDGKYIFLAVLNREQNHMKLNMYKASNGKFVRTLFEEKHDKYVEPEQAIQFIPGKKDEFLWFSERDGFNHIYRYDTKGKLINQVTKGEWEATGIIGYSNNEKYVYFIGTSQLGLSNALYKASLDGKQIEKLTTENGSHQYAISDNAKYFIDNYSNITTPRIIQIIDNDGEQIRKLLTANNPLKGYKVGSAELLELKAEDGTILHGRIIKPSDFNPAKKYPVLTYVYGGPHAQMVSNRWMMSAPLWMYYYAEQGNIIFTLDNRGSANRGFDFENVIHRQLGEHEMRDQIIGANYLKSLPFIDQNKMSIHGWSYGGFMTTSMMLKKPGTYQVGVAGGPVTDWKYYEIMYGERYMDMPEENPEGYELTSLLNKAENLEGDLLLIHGTSDDVVVMQHNLSLIQEFVNKGKQVDFFPYPMHKHNVRGKDRLHLMEKILTYIDEKLK